MKPIIAIAIVFTLTSLANAATITADQIKACEATFREKAKAEKEAAPTGFKPDHPRGYKQAFIAECLSK